MRRRNVPDLTIRLSMGQRDELKKRLRNHPDVKAAGIRVKGHKDELLTLAERYGVAIPDAPAGGDVFADDEALDHLADEDAVREADQADQAGDLEETTGDPDALVKGVLAPLGAGDFETFKGELAKLAKRATTIKVRTVERVVTKTVTVQAAAPVTCKGHVPSVIRHDTAGQLLGLSGPWGKLQMTVWDAPDAPAVDPHYVWPEATAAILSQLRRGRNVMLTGPAGTGKTSFAEQLAARTGRPYCRISCQEGTDAAVLVGMRGPDGKGGMAWEDGQLTAAIRRPGTIVLVDEPSAARPGALMALQAVLDNARTLTIEETGERVPVAPGVCFILADNTAGTGDETGQYEGTRRMNRATLDRCGITARISYLPEDAERAVLVAKTGCTAKTAALAVHYAGQTRAAADGGTLTHGIGVRRLLAWCELVTDGVPHQDAFDLAIWNTAPPDDRETLRQLYRAHISTDAVREARTNG